MANLQRLIDAQDRRDYEKTEEYRTKKIKSDIVKTLETTVFDKLMLMTLVLIIAVSVTVLFPLTKKVTARYTQVQGWNVTVNEQDKTITVVKP